MVAGFIGAIPNNSVGTAGIAYGVKILPISLRLGANGIASSGIRYREAFNHAVKNGVKVISCSWWYPYGTDSNLEAGIINALNTGRVVVFSSGNQYNSSVNYPKAIDSRLLVVGAISQNGDRASFSNYGSALDIVAPGENLRSTTINSGYATGISGTSFAAPQVAGIAALMLSINPSLTQKQVADIIEGAARKVSSYSYATTSGRSNGTWNNQMGYGLVNAYAAATNLPPPTPVLRLDPYYVMNSTTEARVYVENPPYSGSGVYYEWEFNGSVSSWGGGTAEVIVPYYMFPSWGNPNLLILRCRTVFGSVRSSWSTSINVYN
jgi:subtilisin family serine protease